MSEPRTLGQKAADWIEQLTLIANDLQVENKKLQALVDSLSPNYVDTQKPIRCDDNVWIWDGSSMGNAVLRECKVRRLRPCYVTARAIDARGDIWTEHEAECYSTREAAEAAKGTT